MLNYKDSVLFITLIYRDDYPVAYIKRYKQRQEINTSQIATFFYKI